MLPNSGKSYVQPYDRERLEESVAMKVAIMSLPGYYCLIPSLGALEHCSSATRFGPL